jgi:hypothetical protein
MGRPVLSSKFERAGLLAWCRIHEGWQGTRGGLVVGPLAPGRGRSSFRSDL